MLSNQTKANSMESISAQIDSELAVAIPFSAFVVCQLFNVSVNEDGLHQDLRVSLSKPFAPRIYCKCTAILDTFHATTHK